MCTFEKNQFRNAPSILKPHFMSDKLLTYIYGSSGGDKGKLVILGLLFFHSRKWKHQTNVKSVRS